MRKGDGRKAMLAALLRRRTTVGFGWIAIFGSAGEEARAQMKAMMEQFRATETAMRLSELKVNVCYLGLTPKHLVCRR